MHQSGAETLVTEEPYAFIAHARVCGGAGWATAGSTRKADAFQPPLVPRCGFQARLRPSVRRRHLWLRHTSTTGLQDPVN